MNKKNSLAQGISLIELIVVIGILAFLVSVGYGSFQKLLMRQERKLFLAQLKDAIAYARSEAFFRNTVITLCGSHSQEKCHMQKDWSTGFILFENPNRETDPDPRQILRVVPGTRYGKIQFTGISPWLHISATGMTMNIGTFLYCPRAPFDKKEEIEGLVVNRVFRSYFLRENSCKAAGLECR